MHTPHYQAGNMAYIGKMDCSDFFGNALECLEIDLAGISC